jgi:hypothetical protein
MKDLIIGMAAGYTDEQLKPFVNSLKRTGYDGDVILIRQNPYAVHPILSRFDLIPRYIHQSYRYVIACDTSDIVFQSNPFKWLEEHLGIHGLCVVSEHVTFEQSPGNKKNMQEAFPQNWEEMKGKEVCNAGVIAGLPHPVKRICEDIYELCLRDARINAAPIKSLTWDEMISDQSALNILLPEFPTLVAHAEDGFVHEYSHPGNGEHCAILHQYLYTRGDEIRTKYLTP